MSAAPLPADVGDPGEVLASILDPLRRGALYPWYHRLRELEPVHPTHALSRDRAWVLTRHRHVDQVLRDPGVWSDQRNVELFDVGPEGAHFYRTMQRLLLYLDPPEHDRIRGLLSRAFTPRAVEARRPRIRAVVDDLLDRVADRGSMDLVADFAYPLPVVVICEMLGVPAEDLPRFHGWAYDFARRGDVSDVTPERIRAGEAASQGFRDYFLDLIADRRRQPRDDLMTTLVGLRDAQGPLDDDDLVSSCVILLQAGHETTADLIGMGTLALLQSREQLEKLRREPARVPDAVEELIRHDTSVQISQRVAPHDIALDGTVVPAGEVFVILNGAANRDPEVFPEPDRLDVERRPKQHLSFGLGRHICLGASLARAEIAIAIGTLLERLPRLELETDEPEYRASLFLRGLARLPVRF